MSWLVALINYPSYLFLCPSCFTPIPLYFDPCVCRAQVHWCRHHYTDRSGLCTHNRYHSKCGVIWLDRGLHHVTQTCYFTWCCYVLSLQLFLFSCVDVKQSNQWLIWFSSIVSSQPLCSCGDNRGVPSASSLVPCAILKMSAMCLSTCLVSKTSHKLNSSKRCPDVNRPATTSNIKPKTIKLSGSHSLLFLYKCSYVQNRFSC